MGAYFSFFQWNSFQPLVFNQAKVASNCDARDEHDRHKNKDHNNTHGPVGVRDFLVRGLVKKYRNNEMTSDYNLDLGHVQTPYFTWAESNANEEEQRIFLICIRFGSCEVRRLNLALK